MQTEDTKLPTGKPAGKFKDVEVMFDKEGRPVAVKDETGIRYRLVFDEVTGQEQWYYIGKVPKSGCKRCYGTGLVGRNLVTKKFVSCRCIKGVGKMVEKPKVMPRDQTKTIVAGSPK